MMLSESECLAQSILALSVIALRCQLPQRGSLRQTPAEGFFFPSDMLYYNVF